MDEHPVWCVSSLAEGHPVWHISSLAEGHPVWHISNLAEGHPVWHISNLAGGHHVWWVSSLEDGMVGVQQHLVDEVVGLDGPSLVSGSAVWGAADLEGANAVEDVEHRRRSKVLNERWVVLVDVRAGCCAAWSHPGLHWR